jgi:hypothetical protein
MAPNRQGQQEHLFHSWSRPGEKIPQPGPERDRVLAEAKCLEQEMFDFFDNYYWAVENDLKYEHSAAIKNIQNSPGPATTTGASSEDAWSSK